MIWKNDMHDTKAHQIVFETPCFSIYVWSKIQIITTQSILVKHVCFAVNINASRQ